MSDDWCTIESDPGVFTEMLQDLGCPDVELEELYSLDDDNLQSVYGLIFLFQWVGETQKQHAKDKKPLTEVPPSLFFAHQVTTNACATQAILSVVLNAENINLGPTLENFKNFTNEFPPNLKGVAISGSEEIRQVHNRFGRQDAFLNDGKQHIPTGDEEAFHFVAYVPKDGHVYELDGLQTGPIALGEYTDNWRAVAHQAIQERMAQAQQGSIKFNLMAVTQDKRIALREQEGSELLLAREEEKRAQWKTENQRRRHNYVPFCVQLLKELSQAGKLSKKK